MPPASAIATALASLSARFPSAPAACSLAPSLPPRASSTSGAMPPASTIAALLASLWARFISAPAAPWLLGGAPRAVGASSIATAVGGAMPPAAAIAAAMASLKARFRCRRRRRRRLLGGRAAAARQLDQRRDAARLRDSAALASFRRAPAAPPTRCRRALDPAARCRSTSGAMPPASLLALSLAPASRASDQRRRRLLRRTRCRAPAPDDDAVDRQGSAAFAACSTVSCAALTSAPASSLQRPRCRAARAAAFPSSSPRSAAMWLASIAQSRVAASVGGMAVLRCD